MKYKDKMEKIRTLHSFEAGEITRTEYELGPLDPDSIRIKTIFCGVCRSDIGSYNRWEDMPYGGKVGGFGHEGLGEVVEVGSNMDQSLKGKIVATWSDPAYADFYDAKRTEYVIVPEASPKYIIQPVACAINIGSQTINTYSGKDPKILLVGSGFMSFPLVEYLKMGKSSVDVLGNSHRETWLEDYDTKLISWEEVNENQYDIVIDLSSKAENYEKIVKATRVEGLICYASTPYTPVTTNFFETCWKCHNWIFPSPRNLDFQMVALSTSELISSGDIRTDWMWTLGYDVNDMEQVKLAFEDGTNRTPDYMRGYIKW